MRELHVESFGVIPVSFKQGSWHVLLILHQAGNHWSFPKGRKEGTEELPLESALRELKEETGLEVERLLQETPLIERYKFRHKELLIEKAVYYFPAIVKGALVLQEEEVRDARWLTLNAALSLLTFQEARTLCSYVMTTLLPLT